MVRKLLYLVSSYIPYDNAYTRGRIVADLTSEVATEFESKPDGHYNKNYLLSCKKISFHFTKSFHYPGPSFYTAVQKGNIEFVKSIMSTGFDPLGRHIDVLTACHNNDYDMTAFLITLGVDIRFNDDECLFHAVDHDNIPLARLLIRYGCDPSVGNGEFLIHASQAGLSKMVKFLLDEGVNVHSQNETALGEAVINDHIEVAKILLDHGANAHHNGDVIIATAIGLGYHDMAALLIAH